ARFTGPDRTSAVRVESSRFGPDHMRSATCGPGVDCVALLAVISMGKYSPDMADPEERRSARGAIDDFIRHLADGQFAILTRRIRRHFLSEYLHHAQQAAGAVDITVEGLMNPARA